MPDNLFDNVEVVAKTRTVVTKTMNPKCAFFLCLLVLIPTASQQTSEDEHVNVDLLLDDYDAISFNENQYEFDFEAQYVQKFTQEELETMVVEQKTSRDTDADICKSSMIKIM